VLSGLKEATKYHYRIVATNSIGTADSSDATFTTLGRAGEPEFGVCVAQKGGEYRDAGCTSKAKKAKKGKFEWTPAPAPTCYSHLKGEYTNSSCTAKSAKPRKGSFEKRNGPLLTTSSGPVTLETGAGNVACAAGTGSGAITSAIAATERITFTGCELAGKKCTSEGSNGTASGTAGAIETNLLTARLLGPVAGQVWTELVSAEHQPYLAEFGCEGSKLRVKGSLSGVQGGDVGVASATGTTSFGPGIGEQALVSELSEASPFASVATLTLSETPELATEVRP